LIYHTSLDKVDLLIHISPKQPDCRVNKRLAELLSAHAVQLEALARLLRRHFARPADFPRIEASFPSLVVITIVSDSAGESIGGINLPKPTPSVKSYDHSINT
jgi:hypothetical protein